MTEEESLCSFFPNLKIVAAAAAKVSGMKLSEAKDFGLKIRSDSNEWASSDEGFAGFIMWEEGPYEWPYRLQDWMNTKGKSIPVNVEIICGWGLVGISMKER